MVVSDTQIPGFVLPHIPPLQHRGKSLPELGLEVGDRHRRFPSSPGKLAGGSASGRHGPEHPQDPHNLGRGRRARFPAPTGKWEGAFFLPDLLPTVHPGGSGAGWGGVSKPHSSRQGVGLRSTAPFL